MNIQSVSVVVPGGCPNKCKFCVSDMHEETYPNQIEKNIRFRDLYEKDYLNRLQFARDNGCNTALITGSGEPLTNPRFLEFFSHMNRSLTQPFRWIELQTSGVTLDEEKLRWLRNSIGVSTISLSVSDIFDIQNNEIMGVPPEIEFSLKDLCDEIHRYDFNIRLSLNLSEVYEGASFLDILARARELHANQVTLRQLYSSGDSPQARWVASHSLAPDSVMLLREAVKTMGRPLERLPFGAMRYSVQGISFVIDGNCMATDVTDEESIRYLILRPNCKIYTRWDDPGSLLF